MAEPAYDAILFDLDGTLVAPRFEHVRRVFDDVGDRVGYAFTDEEARRLWHGLGAPRNEQLRELGLDVAEFWRVFDATENPQERAAAMEVHEDAAIAAELDAPTALVTHCPPEPTAAVLDHHDLDAWFDAVVCCSDELGWKPDPSPLVHALSELGMDHLADVADGQVAADGGQEATTAPGARADDDRPQDAMPGAPAEQPAGALYVGDTEGDVGAAWNAGLDAVHVERFDHDRRQRCVLADYRVSTLADCEPLQSLLVN